MFELGVPLGRGGRARPGFRFDGALPSGAVLARPSGGTYVASTGLIAAAGADVARFGHDPAALDARGLVIEAAAENRLDASGTVGGAGWNRSAVAYTPNAATAPDGSMAAARLQSASGSEAQGVDQSVTVTAGGYFASIYLKTDGIRFIQFLSGGFSSAQFATFDLVSGLASSAGSAGIEAAGDGWWRCWMGATLAAGTGQFIAWAVDSLGAPRASTFTGDGLMAVLAWGAQLEAGATPTSYVASTVGPAARAADVLTLDFGSRGVADGTHGFRAVFDDFSSGAFEATVSGGTMSVPTPLARRHVRAIELA